MKVVELASNLIGRRKEDVVLNTSIEVVVGGLGDTKPKRLQLREPSNRRFTSHVTWLVEGLTEAIGGAANQRWLESIIRDLRKGEWPDALSIDDVKKSAPVVAAVTHIIADIVEEDEDYVENEMGPEQMAKLCLAYYEVVGSKTFSMLFKRALQRFQDEATAIGGRSSK